MLLQSVRRALRSKTYCVCKHFVRDMSLKGGYWREAASVILASPNPQGNGQSSSSLAQKYAYNILMLKRSGKSKFMPETYVFPGGVSGDEDFSDSWITHYEAITGKSFEELSKDFLQREFKAPIWDVERNCTMPAEVAFRICALRETFEESGVLLIKRKSYFEANNKLQNVSKYELATPQTSRSLNLADWRKRVNKDASEFLLLCEKLDAVPDIWSLHEWSNWLTPVMQKVTEPPERPRRFDTLFYVCCLDHQPEARVDRRETTTSQWENPGGLLEQHHRGEIEMIGPQLYELSRLCNFNNVEDLKRFCVQREPHGFERWMPHVMLCSDGIMTLLPGDDRYPDVNMDYAGQDGVKSTEETIDELNSKSKQHNRHYRYHSKDGGRPRIGGALRTSAPACGHLRPFHVDVNMLIKNANEVSKI